MSRAVSAKIPDELKKKADRYGLKIGKLPRETLEAKISAIESQMLSSRLDGLSSSIGSRIAKKDVIKSVRSSRER